MKLVLFDILNTLVKDSIDISKYLTETIRNVYGLYVEVNMRDYAGMSTQEIIEDILTKNGISKEEIDAKADLLPNDLYYAYYNVAGHAEQEIIGGAPQVLEALSKNGVLLGIASGEVERIGRFRLERANLANYFKVYAFGNEAKSFRDIAKLAIERARKSYDVDKIFFVANSLQQVEAASELGIVPIAISGDSNAELLKKAGAKDVINGINDRRRIVNLILNG